MRKACSFRSARARSGSISELCQPTMLAWRGGGSSGSTSSGTVLTWRALTIAAPCSVLIPTACSASSQRAVRGSAPCREIEVLPSPGGRKAEGFTIVVLNWLEDVRNRARSSSSATASGSPEGSSAINHDPLYTVKYSCRDNVPVKARNRVPSVRAIQPRIR